MAAEPQIVLPSLASALLSVRLRLGSNTRNTRRKLFEQEKPDCIVLDCAPTAQLAAYFFGIKTLQISNGFDAPPVDCPTFGVGLRGQHIEQVNAVTVTALDEVLALLGRNLVKRTGASLARYLGFPQRLVARIPEVDPYGWRQDVSYHSLLPVC